MEKRNNFICPLDVGFLSSELNTPEDLARFLNYFGIGIEGINQLEVEPQEDGTQPTTNS